MTISAVLDHLWQSTLFALAAGLLALVFRNARASVRYGLWFAASAKFLAPFAVLGALGRLAPELRPPGDVGSGAVLIAAATQPFSQAPAAPVHAASLAVVPVLIGLALWALGCAAVLLFWASRWAEIRAALRSATPLAVPAPMRVMASSWAREPGLVGLWRPVLLVPDTLFEHLEQPSIDALLAHEAQHLTRRDNLTGALHMLVEALFWFHPLVWWIGARLVEERERACDEAVVGAGHDRAAYATALVECSRLYLQSPLACVAGATGSHLKERVQTIMTEPDRPALSRAGKALLLGASALAFASPVAAGWLTSPSGRQAMAQAAAIAAPPIAVRHAHSRPIPGAPAARRETEVARVEVATARSAAAPGEPAPLALAESKVALAPGEEVSKPSLTLVSEVRAPDATEPLGPGHYVERSGVKASGDCNEQVPAWYSLATRPIAPGHIITNFQYELRGDGRCDKKWPGDQASAECEVSASRADKRTVRFHLLPNRNYCFSFTAFAQDGPYHSNEAQGTLTENGAVSHAEMVISYDVQ